MCIKKSIAGIEAQQVNTIGTKTYYNYKCCVTCKTYAVCQLGQVVCYKIAIHPLRTSYPPDPYSACDKEKIPSKQLRDIPIASTIYKEVLHSTRDYRTNHHTAVKPTQRTKPWRRRNWTGTGKGKDPC